MNKRVLALATALPLCGLACAAREPLPVEQRSGIKVVYQIKTDEWKEGVGSGLHYVEKLMKAYEKMDIGTGQIEVHAVLHGNAGYWLLTDAAYRNETGKDADNPNRAVVERLLKQGVQIELCANTMESRGWNDADVMEGVAIVAGAYPRIIDLQLQGFAYIRF